MENTFFYYWHELDCDIAFDVSYQLYTMRMERQKTLAEVAAATGLSLSEIDTLETGLGKIDFANVTSLLDFYNAQFDMCYDCFPGLPKAVCQKYFKY